MSTSRWTASPATASSRAGLSGRNLEDARESVRIENEENKRSPLDFALWKSAKPGEPSWESPWGAGRPGWHIECSAMNLKAFGEQIDIHGGGRDLVFPHHENEIAQTEALTGKQFAKYWIHNGLIKVNGQKMSKSLGNSLLLSDLLARYSPEVIKFALLQTNYRGDINVTDSLFPDAEKHLVSFYTVLADAEKAGVPMTGSAPEVDAEFDKAMDDDFNTAKARPARTGQKDLFPARALPHPARRIPRPRGKGKELGHPRRSGRARRAARRRKTRKRLGDGGRAARRDNRGGLRRQGLPRRLHPRKAARLIAAPSFRELTIMHKSRVYARFFVISSPCFGKS